MMELCPVPRLQFFGNDGNPLVGGYLYTYYPGTPGKLKFTYTDSEGNNLNTDPIILDSAGRANIWLDGAYYMELWTGDKNIAGNTLVWSQDNVSAGVLSTISANMTAIETVYNNITAINAAAEISAIYQGVQATDPTTRVDGTPLQEGDQYFNSTTHISRVYTGSAWVDDDGGAGASAAAAVQSAIEAAASASMLADGDKGDITVSSSGTVWTIDDDAVTVAKIDSTYEATLVKKDVAQTFTKTQTPSRSAVTPSAAIDWDASDKQVLEVTLTATRLFNAPTNLVAGTFYSIRLIGAYVPTWNAVFKNISSYTCATTATKADFLTFYCSDGTNLELVGIMYNCNGGA